MAKERRTFLLKLESYTGNLKLIRKFVTQIAAEAGFTGEDIDKIELAVDEACSNVVLHAYHTENKNNLEIDIEYDSRAFRVTILDKGQGFDPDQLPQTDMKKYLEKYHVGGLGIHLMNSLMDRVEYSINPGKKNKVILTKFKN